VPWRVALALQEDGWNLRSDIIWNKSNAMPEAVNDRPTKAHEYIFLMSKSRSYYYDSDAIQEPSSGDGRERKQGANSKAMRIGKETRGAFPARRNKRTVWTVATAPYEGAHFATYPPDLIKPCILAGCRPGGIVLDPFFGSGTTGRVAEDLGRKWLGIELNEGYRDLIETRTAQTGMMFEEGAK
jgi:site-specific DNA-methyltransferase (cytosine-N4-specific)